MHTSGIGARSKLLSRPIEFHYVCPAGETRRSECPHRGVRAMRASARLLHRGRACAPSRLCRVGILGPPVPSFGDPNARVLALGLAPGAHGSNRTGRPFTGDGSGDFLYPVLYEAGFASQPNATSRDDGMRLTDFGLPPWRVARRRATSRRPRSYAIARHGSTKNRPVAQSARGRVPWPHRVRWSAGPCATHRTASSRAGYIFGHGAEYTLPSGLRVIASFHPSLQNTNTGRLTRPMFLAIFRRARQLAESGNHETSP